MPTFDLKRTAVILCACERERECVCGVCGVCVWRGSGRASQEEVRPSHPTHMWQIRAHASTFLLLIDYIGEDCYQKLKHIIPDMELLYPTKQR